jgi:ABC-type bacteriocin/lantibiotic exporter with double-glycine peptidase domain
MPFMSKNFKVLREGAQLISSYYPSTLKLIAFFFVLAGSELALLVSLPLTNAKIINALVAFDYRGFQRHLIIAALLAVGYVLVSLIVKTFVFKSTEDVSFKIRLGLFEKLLGRKYESIDAQSPGDIISRLTNDVGLIKNFLLGIFCQLIIDIITVLVVIVVLSRISVALTILALITTPISLFIGIKGQSTIAAKSKDLREAFSRLTSSLHTWLSRALNVKIHALENVADTSFAEENGRFKTSSISFGKTQIRLEALNGFLYSIPNLIILGYGGFVVFDGDASVGDLFAFLTLASYFLGPSSRILKTLTIDLPSLQSPIERLNELRSASQSSAPIPGTSENGSLISFSGLRFTLYKNNFIVNDFKILKGQKIAIVGRNGSGKSSFAKLVAGLVEPWQGNLAIAEFAGNTHYMPQSTSLFPGTVLDNLTLYDRSPDIHKLSGLTSDLSLTEWMNRFPNGLSTVINETNFSLVSGGEMQKINLCRALYSSRKKIILDEPDNFVEQGIQEKLPALIEKYCAGKTIFIISHSASLSAFCDVTITCAKESDVYVVTQSK